MVNIFGWVLAALGFIMIIGTAGADCDGDCMEKALTMAEVMKYTMLGLGMIIVGVALGVKK
jgi:hypothetical protein